MGSGNKIVFLSLLMTLPGLMYGYANFSDCSGCHDDFRDGLHDLHVKNPDPVTKNCNLCHNPSGGEPFLMWSAGDNGSDGLGCMGCHGRDYGETVTTADGDNPAMNGKPKNSGVGLRKFHAEQQGHTFCYGCHAGDPEPYPENVIDPGLGNTVHYYLRNDVSLGDKPVDPSNNEDSENDADSVGQDNDGDGDYDMADTDSVTNPSEVFIAQLANGDLQLTWPTPSPDWLIQKSTTLGNDWVDLPAPAATDRQNGFWIVDVPAPLDPNAFYRASDTPAPAALSAAVSTVPPKAKRAKPVRK